MGQVTVKLMPAHDDVWEYVEPTHLELIRCPVCFTPVRPVDKSGHIKWHQDIAEMVKTLAGSKGFLTRGG